MQSHEWKGCGTQGAHDTENKAQSYEQNSIVAAPMSTG